MYENTTGSLNNAIGTFALRNITTGNGNVALGQASAYNLTTGSHNVAIGRESYVADTTGTFNVAVGYRALFQSAGGSENTAIGVGALEFGVYSNRNTAIGRGAMFNHGTATQNTAVGFFALAGQTFDNGGTPYFSNNTAIGFQAMQFNNPTATNNGNRNVAVGLQSLRNNTIGANNTSVGFQNMFSNTTGVRNVSVGDIALATNNSGSDNVAIGFAAAVANTTAGSNIAIGTDALRVQSFSNGDTPFETYNIAIGRAALFNNQPVDNNNSGRLNVGVGAFALNANTTGVNNTAIGTSSFRIAINNSFNTGLGTFSGFYSQGASNTYIGFFSGAGVSGSNTGSANTAVGHQSLSNITTGNQNTAIGDFALAAVSTGDQNTALGAGALDGNQAGERNTSIGMFSGRTGATIFTGSDNVYLGYQAGAGNSTGSNNTLLGTNANTGVDNLVYATAIGSGAVVSQSNSIALGGNTVATRTRVGINSANPLSDLDIRQYSGSGVNQGTGGLNLANGGFHWRIYNSSNFVRFNYSDNNGATYTARAYVQPGDGSWNQLSDISIKNTISPLNSVLNKVMMLYPVTYKYNYQKDNNKFFTGFIAQEVAEIFPENVSQENENELLGINYAGFSVIAIKAIQEQQEIIDQLIKRIEELEAKINK